MPDTAFPGWDALTAHLPEDAQWWDDGLSLADEEALRGQWRAQMALHCRHIVEGPERPPLIFRYEPGCWVVAYDGGFWDSPAEQPTFATHAEAVAFVAEYVNHPAWVCEREAVAS